MARAIGVVEWRNVQRFGCAGMTTAEVTFYTGAKSSNRARMEGTVLEGTVTGCQGRTKVDSHRQFQVRMGQSKGDFPAFGGELFSKLSAPDETDSSDVHGSVESGRNKGVSRLLVEVKGWVSEEHNRCSLTTPGHFQGCFQGASRSTWGTCTGTVGHGGFRPERGPPWIQERRAMQMQRDHAGPGDWQQQDGTHIT